jgi:hypothetical protein
MAIPEGAIKIFVKAIITRTAIFNVSCLRTDTGDSTAKFFGDKFGPFSLQIYSGMP